MTIPEWADGQLSKALPDLLSQGENQGLEYMETFPKNARELGKGFVGSLWGQTNEGVKSPISSYLLFSLSSPPCF